MARFLLVVLPLTGHLNAMLAIGQALEAAGHELAWCGPEPDLAPLLGDRATIYPTGKRYYRRYGSTGLEAARALWDGFLLPFNRFIVEPVSDALVDYRPDVLLVDQYAIAAAAVAERAGVRWATLCTGAMELTPPDWELPGHQAWVAERLARIAGWVDLTTELDLRFSPRLVLALTGAGLVGDAPLPPNCLLIGPALGQRPDDPAFDWHGWDPDRRQLLVTVGTSSDHLAADFYRRVLDGLRPLADRLQPVLIGTSELVPELPDYALLVERLPMLTVLPRLAAVLCHAGLGTVTEALAFGVPLVVAPIRHDQPAVARQLVAAGAGRQVCFDAASPDELAEAISAVLDQPGYRDAARRIAAEFTAAGGAGRAAAELARLAEAG